MSSQQRDYAAALPDSSDDLGTWPQRLLHVQSMTSCQAYVLRRHLKRDPAISYYHPDGRWFDEPAYRALSYTWRRFEIRDPIFAKNVEALMIHNIDWEVPKIDPACFTHQEFKAAVTHACLPFPQGQQPHNDGITVEFVWVDVACIGQRDTDGNGNVMKAVEIGRQADIFQQSIGVVAWLWGDMLFVQNDGISMLREHSDTDFTNVPPRDTVKTLIQIHTEILGHQWFKSLWTL